MKVPEALEATTKEEMEKLVDMDKVIKEALRRTEKSGIVFLDEIDKVASRGGVVMIRRCPVKGSARSPALH